MKKSLLLVMAAALYAGSSFTASADYCGLTGTRTSSTRSLTSFTLTDGTNSKQVMVNQSGTTKWFDKTNEKLVTSPGATISFSEITSSIIWMHGYVYIDYNNDQTFSQTLNADGTTGGELVSASLYTSTNISDSSEDNKTAGYAYTINQNSKMEYVGRDKGVTTSSMPSFTLPSDLPIGEYRLRLKVDWYNLDPCGGTDVTANGGCICDMIIKIPDPNEEPEVEACIPTYGGTGTNRTTTGTGGNSSGRYISNINVSDGVTNVDVNGIANGTNRSVYAGSASTTLRTSAGSAITLTMTGSWNAMNHFVYVDSDKNGFDQTDLVYSTENGNSNKVHTFNLPQDISAGKHLVRYKLDWRSNDPCKFAEGENNNGEVVIDFFIEIENDAEPRTVTVASEDDTLGTVAIQGTTETTVTTADAVVLVATPAEGYSFTGWYNGADLVSTANPYTYTGTDAADFVAHFAEKTYPVMKRYITNGATDDNRYLGSLTCTGEALTETLFEFTEASQVPYIAYNPAQTGENADRTTDNACVDMTSYKIQVPQGTQSFGMNLKGYNGQLGGHNPYLNWTQETHYVDWNGNKEFTDAGEKSEKSTLYGNSNPINTDGIDVTVNIPADQPAGEYRMRVVFFGPIGNGENATEDKGGNWDNVLFTTLNNEIRDGISYDFTIEILDNPVGFLTQGEGTVKVATAVTNVTYIGSSTTKVKTATPAGTIIDKVGSYLNAPAGTTLHVFATPGEGKHTESVIGDNEYSQGGSNFYFVDTDGDDVNDSNYVTFIVPENFENVSVTFVEGVLDIDNLATDLNNGISEVYDLRGIKVSAEQLVRGNVYIMRSGNTIQKVLVK